MNTMVRVLIWFGLGLSVATTLVLVGALSCAMGVADFRHTVQFVVEFVVAIAIYVCFLRLLARAK